MSSRNWQWSLLEGESLLWQGRPAPRCYTFRNWKIAAAETLLFLACSFWLMLAYQLVEAENDSSWLILVPIPLLLVSLILGPGQLILARWGWGKLFYALSDSRLLVRKGLFRVKFYDFPLGDLQKWQQKHYGENLVSLRLLFSGHKPIVLECLEQPQNLIQHLSRILETQNAAKESV